MKKLAAILLASSIVTPALAEQCLGGGVPRLNEVARRLHVRPGPESRSALNACDGRAYEIGTLLAAAMDRIERLEANQRKEKNK